MKSAAVFIAVILVFFSASFAAGAEGHDASGALIEFQADRAHVKITVEPENFQKGSLPKITAELSDHQSGNPVLEAELYILIGKAGHATAHGALHVTTQESMPGLDHTSGGMSEDGMLDFGEPSGTRDAVDLSSYRMMKPQSKAGTFAVDYPIEEKGEYRFTLALKSIDGKRYSEPFLVGGRLIYEEASKAPFYRMLFVMGVVVLSGLGGLWVISLRKAANIPTGRRLNILDIPWVKRFVRSGWFQAAFQIPALLFFLLIMAAGLFDTQKGDQNIATLLMWTIWWAAIIFTFVFVGRVWCMMCPFGAIQDWLGRLFGLNKDFPKPVRNIWLSSFIFFGLTWWDSYSGIVNKPALTALLLIGFFAVASGMAVIFKGRSFCRYVCPIGGLIGLYSMFSPVELRNRCMDVCREHKVKECIKGTNKSRPCPMFVTPMTLDRNNYCNFCSECVKSCSQGNIVIGFRSFAKDLWASSKGYMDEAFLAMVLVGMTIIVTGEMVQPWHIWMDAIGKLMPFDALGITDHAVREKATFLAVMSVGSLLAPMALLVLAAVAVRTNTGPVSPLSLKDTVKHFAYMFIPVGLSMHLAHNISHLFKEGPGIIPAFQRAAVEHLGLAWGEPDWVKAYMMGNEAIFWLQMMIFMAMNVFALYAGYRISVRHYGEKAIRAFIPMAVLAVIFMLINVYVLGQPMAMRHTH